MSEWIGRLAGFLSGGQNVMLNGLEGTSKVFVLAELLQALGTKIVYAAGEEELAHDTARTLRGIIGPEAVYHLGAYDYFSKGAEATRGTNLQRAASLARILHDRRRPGVIVTSAPALLFDTAKPSVLQDSAIVLAAGIEINQNDLARRLVTCGYSRCTVVERPGQFALRGGIMDVFPIDTPKPVRVDFFGDEIESMRYFAPDTQRSHEKVKTITLSAASEEIGERGTVWDYFDPAWPIWVDEPNRFREAWAIHTRRYKTFLQQSEGSQREHHLTPQSIAEWNRCLTKRGGLYHSFFAQSLPDIPVALLEHVAQRECEPFWARPGALEERIREWRQRGMRVLIAAGDKAGQNRMRQQLSDAELISAVELVDWKIDKGFVSATLGVALVSERDIAGKRGQRTAKSSKPGTRVTAGELSIGDYVVHENHGIGLFKGMTTMEVDGIQREYLLVQYAGTDRLYVPLDKLNMLSRYSGADTKEPKLSKLGGNDWERTKKRVTESIQEMAGELIALYAARERLPGFAFSSDTVWQKEFEEAFEYEETPDQARAVIEVKKDMEKNRPMDRLVCGDVGYGKTEVAMRAAFKAVMDRKQVAVLVPTTVLAEQHFLTFSKRFEQYPVVIDVLSRFKSASQQKKTVEDIKRGVVDIIIGTHRMLSADVSFGQLGLLIIDEEHRFGVRQKERIKALKETVDVVTLSATPIPRSLHMALTGLRDLSVIETPPPERYPITTYVMEHNPEIVREAIQYELDRKGQIFYVHNRINDIERIKREIEEMTPGIRVDIGHGRMNEEELSRVMRRFMAAESDVLLCTTIIESGLDLPNVNTLIVDQADHMGLAQLYQIRGRVGRSNRAAYAYLTFRPDKAVSETAQKRLNAIREFTELGSGMKIALRDLEIRGAGNILGAEQHGHIEAIGFDLYCRLLEEETAKFRGGAQVRRDPPALEVKVDTHIPDAYIDEPGLKIQFYKQIMMADRLADIDELEQEMTDRFGPLPEPTANLLRISRLRLIARDKAIKNIQTDRNRVELILEAPLGNRAKGLMELRDKYNIEIGLANQNTLVLDFSAGLSLPALEELIAII